MGGGGDRSADEEVMQLKLQRKRREGKDFQESEGRGGVVVFKIDS